MLEDWVEKNLHKARAILALAASDWSQDRIREVLKCQKARVGEVHTWFKGLGSAEASKFVSDTKVQRAWYWLGLEQEGVPQPKLWEILERFGHASSRPDLDDAIKAHFGWEQGAEVITPASGGTVRISGRDF